LDTADPATVVAAPSEHVGDDGEETVDGSKDGGKTASSPTNVGGPGEAPSPAESKSSELIDGISENVKPEDPQTKSLGSFAEEGENINDIAESRTFLAKVCSRSTTIHWLDLAEYEGSDVPQMHGMVPVDNSGYAMNPAQQPVAPVDPNQAQYYAHAMGYAAQQHQNALKSHQQYFFQMQQRHQKHYAAQQAAWQAQYGGQPPMQMAPQGPPPPQGVPPPPPPEGPAPAPVTAGEAAAQQQKRNRQLEESAAQQQQPQRHPQRHSGHPPQGHHPQGQQQQQWMLYQQMYQAQLPPQPHQYPAPSGERPHEQPQDGSNAGMHSGATTPNNEQQHYEETQSAEGNGKASHDNDAKRQRLV
jgi:hypothetical protein